MLLTEWSYQWLFLFSFFLYGAGSRSCLVLRPPNGPNARPQYNTLHKGNSKNSLEEIMTSQLLDQHSKIPTTKAKGYILLQLK